MTKKLLLIDGHSLAYRAFYSSPLTMTLSDGQPINAVYGFISLLIKALEKFQPTHLCICFDRKEPTFRHELYTEYKAHRPPTPPEFIPQVPLLIRAIEDIGISTLDKPGFEADDLIGTLSAMAEKEQFRSFIMTGDKDELQLISTQTSVIMNKKGLSDIIIYTPEELLEKTQLTPAQIIDLKALEGDTSDNIPGVPGIGEITAKKLLAQYANLDNIYENLTNITSKSIREKLSQNKELAYLSYKLAKIDREIPLTVSLDSFAFQINWNRMISMFKEFEFNSLVKKYQHLTNISTPLFDFMESIINPKKSPLTENTAYTLIQDIEDLKKIIPTLKKGFAFEFFTNHTDAMSAQIAGIAITAEEKKAYYIPLNAYLAKKSDINTLPLFMDTELSQKTSLKSNPFLNELDTAFSNPNIPKYTHHGKRHMIVLKNYGLNIKNIEFDTMLAGYLLGTNTPFDLPGLAQRYLKADTTQEEIFKPIDFTDLPIEKAVQWGGLTVDVILRLTHILQKAITEKELTQVLYEIELPLQHILAEMEFTGVCLDTAYLNQVNIQFQEEMNQLTKKIYHLAGTEFNLNSPKQVQEILFQKMGLPSLKKTKEGFSTDASVLEKLAKSYDIAKFLLRFRTLEKLKNTYMLKLPYLIHPRTHRLHTSFNQTGTQTGRLSSSHPNLQNIPIKTKDGEKIRRAFIPSQPENLIISADYSQIELRIMAHLAKDPSMIQAFLNHEDIHQSTASIIFNMPKPEVTPELRNRAKAINFGIIYGISSYGLSEYLNIPVSESQEIINEYFNKFKKIKEFITDTTSFTENHQYVKTEFGRIRFIPEIHSSNKMHKQMAIRTAVNTRVQGTAADIIKIAMIKIQNKLEENKLSTKMILQIHDELVFDTPVKEKQEITTLIKSEMENAANFSIPLTVDITVGKNWLDGNKI